MANVNVQGERWFPLETNFTDEIKEYWGNWYCDSEVGKLRDVLIRKPGKEIEIVNSENYSDFRWKAPMDVEKARYQIDNLVEIYKEYGVNVHFVEEQREDKPNAIYMRDLVFMTPEGAIIARPAIEARRGEEKAAAFALSKLGVPIVRTINGNGVFDGACAMWVDRHTVILGTGSRANAEGAAQVEYELRRMGVTDILHMGIAYGHAHLDGIMNFVDKKKMILFPWQVSYDVVKPLLDKGIEIIEITDIEEVKNNMAINVVALEPGKVLMVEGNPNTKKKIEDAGVEVIEVDLSEIKKGWGAIHCMSVFLNRDPV